MSVESEKFYYEYAYDVQQRLNKYLAQAKQDFLRGLDNRDLDQLHQFAQYYNKASLTSMCRDEIDRRNQWDAQALAYVQNPQKTLDCFLVVLEHGCVLVNMSARPRWPQGVWGADRIESGQFVVPDGYDEIAVSALPKGARETVWEILENDGAAHLA